MLKHTAPILALALLAAATPSRADVTVTMQGTFQSNAFQPTPAQSAAFNAIANGTSYYKGSVARFDTGRYIVIEQTGQKTCTIIEPQTRHYYTYNRKRLGVAAYMRLIVQGLDPNVVVRVVSSKNLPYRFEGHKCRRYIAQLSVYMPLSGANVGFTFQQLFAVDFPGVNHVEQTVTGTTVKGVLLHWELLGASDQLNISLRSDAVAISTTQLAASTFDLGNGVTKADASSTAQFDPSNPMEISGYMSSKPIDPYANLNQFTGAAKAQNLIKAGKFDEAGDVVRELAKRGLNTTFGPIYNALGDHSESMGKVDEAWGWYSLAVGASDIPDDIVHARFALEGYYASRHDTDNATKQLQAILDLPSAKQEDKDHASSLMTSLKGQ